MFKQSDNNKSARKAGLLFLLLAMITVAGSALAVPQVMTRYGDQMGWYSAEINGMGGTGVAVYRGGLSNIFNPAYLTMEEGTRLDAGFSLDQEHEDRFQPLFDSFGGFLAEGAIATNRHHFWQTGFALAHRVNQIEALPVTFGLSLADRYSYQYNFEEEIRDPETYPPSGSNDPAQDLIIEEHLRNVEGTLRTLSLGAGVQIIDQVSIGVAAHYAFGKRTETNSMRANWVPEDSYNHTDEYELSGVNYTIGLRGVVNERLEVGVSWESQLSATGDFTWEYADAGFDSLGNPATIITSSGDDAPQGYYRYPNIYRAGLTFLPRTDPRTVFTMEMEYTPWSEMADSEVPGYDNPQNLDDTVDVRIGLQHTFYNGMPLRFGFRHFDSYMDKESGASVFSTGVGMPVLAGMVSVSLELAKIINVLDHQFPYPTDFDGEFSADPQARVEDTRFRLGISFVRNF